MKEYLIEGRTLYLKDGHELNDRLKQNCINIAKTVTPNFGTIILGDDTFVFNKKEVFEDYKKIDDYALNAIKEFKNNPPDFTPANLYDKDEKLVCGMVQLIGGLIALIPIEEIKSDSECPDVVASIFARQLAINQTEVPTIKGYFY